MVREMKPQVFETADEAEYVPFPRPFPSNTREHITVRVNDAGNKRLLPSPSAAGNPSDQRGGSAGLSREPLGLRIAKGGGRAEGLRAEVCMRSGHSIGSERASAGFSGKGSLQNRRCSWGCTRRGKINTELTQCVAKIFPLPIAHRFVIERSGAIWAARNTEVLRADEGEGWEKRENLRESPPASGFVRHDSHSRRIWGSSSLTPTPPWLHVIEKLMGSSPILSTTEQIIIEAKQCGGSFDLGLNVSLVVGLDGHRCENSVRRNLRPWSVVRDRIGICQEGFRKTEIRMVVPEMEPTCSGMPVQRDTSSPPCSVDDFGIASACTRQKAESKYRNRIRLERVSKKQSSDTHKTPYDLVKRCRERTDKNTSRRPSASTYLDFGLQPTDLGEILNENQHISTRESRDTLPGNFRQHWKIAAWRHGPPSETCGVCVALTQGHSCVEVVHKPLPGKIRRPVALSGTTRTCGNPGLTQPGDSIRFTLVRGELFNCSATVDPISRYRVGGGGFLLPVGLHPSRPTPSQAHLISSHTTR
ncbi:hypothetical protein PR048_028012 [Dryococelus australis]|uniref:Uncharacterized protein n=1 Tax=Dryococelus australis TaxID=614101 RepID=A0ABQ9GI38_9NEOP|nr:hypothetical protein PR048_028012 [Dryococelus australis]